MDTETTTLRFTPPDRISADHWQAMHIARQLALGMHGYDLDEADRKLALDEWIDACEPLVAADRPDIPEAGRMRLLCGIAANVILMLRELDAMSLPSAGRA